MEHFRLLAFLAVCFAAAARADPEPITTPFIPCKVLPPLKALNLQQVRDFFLKFNSDLLSATKFSLLLSFKLRKMGIFLLIALHKVFYASASSI